MRLINSIKNEEKIIFIRHNNKNVEEKEIKRFYENMKILNDKLIFHFILITHNNNLKISNEILQKHNFIFINLSKHKIKNNNYQEIIESYKYIYLQIKEKLI